MQRLTVRAKLVWAFSTLIGVVLVIAAAGITLLSSANERFDDYVNGSIARLHLLEEMRQAVDRRAIAARNLVLLTQKSELSLEQKAVTQAHADVTRSLAELQRLTDLAAVPAEEKRLLATIAEVEKRYAPVALAIVDLALKGEHDRAIAQMNDECRPLLAQLSAAAQAFSESSMKSSQALLQEARSAYHRQRNGLLLGVGLAVVLSVLAGVAIMRSLLNDLGAEPAQLRDIFSAMSEGDLTQPIHLRAGDQHSVLAAVGRMQSSLIHMASQVRQDADALSSAAGQIAAGNNDLAARTESQAASLEQTSAAMGEFGGTIVQNADNANLANQLAQSASEVAAHGGHVVGQVVDTMQGINDSSRRIADIIGVIDSIAFQTNILALNAAVEAARAGEQGRGFAVVATEVRSLAGRSATAAREIKSLITESVNRVEQGTTQVEDAGKTMNDIVAGIQQVTEVVEKIARASQEQSRNVSEVGNAITRMDDVTKQNAALVEEMAAGASHFKQMADNLVGHVANFKLPTHRS